MNKNLIYYSLGYKNSETYIKLLKISILTLIKTGYTGDILILIDNDVLITLIRSNIHVINQLFFCNVKDFSTDLFLQNSPTYKLLIQQFKNINYYEKILFCDVDTIWIKHPFEIFDIINNSGVSFGSGLRYPTEVLMSHEIGVWGGWLLNDTEKHLIEQQNILGSNSGIFGFTYENSYVLTKTYEYMKHVIELLRSNIQNTDIAFIDIALNVDMKFNIQTQNKILKLLPIGIEQPFINVCSWRLNKYNRTLSDLAYSGGSRPTFLKDFKNDVFKKLCVVHFPDNVGAFDNKIKNMNNFLKTLNYNINI